MKVLTLAAIFVLCFRPSMRAQEDVGRFQLVAATIFNAQTKQQVQRLFKIDTKTGDVWELMHSEADFGRESVQAEGWQKVRDDYQAQLELMLKAKQSVPQSPAKK